MSGSRLVSRLRDSAIAPAAVLLAVVLLLRYTSDDEYAISLATDLCVYVIALSGLNLITGYGGQLQLASAAFMGIGAYVMALGTIRHGFSPLPMIGCAILAAAAIAVIVGAPTLRLRGLYFAIATLAVGIVFTNIVTQNVEFSGGPDGIGTVPSLELFGVRFATHSEFFIVAAALAILVTFLVNVYINSWAGWALRAARESEAAASGVGVPIFLNRLAAFAISGALGGLAGALGALSQAYVSPSSFTFTTSVDLFLVLFIGGMGSRQGPLIGAFILYAFSRWLTPFAGALPLILGVTFLLFLKFFPGGVAGVVSSAFGAVRRVGKRTRRNEDVAMANSSNA